MREDGLHELHDQISIVEIVDDEVADDVRHAVAN